MIDAAVCALLYPGHAPGIAAAGERFAYDAPFLHWRLPGVLGLLAALAAVEFTAAVRGPWTPGLRWLEIALLAALAIQANWRGDGYLCRVFVEPRSNDLARLAMEGLALALWLLVGVRTYIELGRVPPPTSAPPAPAPD